MPNDTEALNTIDAIRRRVFLFEAINLKREGTDSDPPALITASEMVNELQRILSEQISELPLDDHDNLVSIFKSADFAGIAEQATQFATDCITREAENEISLIRQG